MNNTLLKGLSVLELLSRSSQPVGITQIARELRIAKSNVHRLMQALVETRYVLRDDASGAYGPSVKLWELGSAVLANLDLRRHAQHQMEALVARTGESAHLSVLDGREVVYVHKVESEQPVRAYSQIGGRAPAACVATGKVLLANSPASVLAGIAAALEAHTDRTITDGEAFLREMKKVRMQGYAINRGEWRDGVWGIAAPIVDTRGTVIAAIGISGPAARFRKPVLPAWTEDVIAAAREVADALGGGQPTLSRVRLRAH